MSRYFCTKVFRVFQRCVSLGMLGYTSRNFPQHTSDYTCPTCDISPQQAAPAPVSRGSYGQTTRPQPRQPAALGVGSTGTAAVESVGPHTRSDKQFAIGGGAEHRVYDTRKEEMIVDIVQDHDKDKYKRRSALHWFARWFKSRTSSRKPVDSNAQIKRIAVLLLICLLAFFTFVIIMTSVGRASGRPPTRPHEQPQHQNREKNIRNFAK
nr:zinc finger protein-like 1 homolog [Lytechinus pictus]